MDANGLFATDDAGMSNPLWILPEGVEPTPLEFQETLALLPETVASRWWIANAGVVPVLDWSLLALAGKQILLRSGIETDSVSMWIALEKSPGGHARMEEILLEGVSLAGGISMALEDPVWDWWAEAWAATRSSASGELFELLWGVVDKRGNGLEAASGIVEVMQSLLSDARLVALYPLSDEETLLRLVCAPGAGELLWGAILEDPNTQISANILLVGILRRDVRRNASMRERLLSEMVFEMDGLERMRDVIASTDEGHAFWVEACRRAFVAEGSNDTFADMLFNAVAMRPFTADTLSWLASSKNADIRQWVQMQIVPDHSL
jgi:hypothetical protein